MSVPVMTIMKMTTKTESKRLQTVIKGNGVKMLEKNVFTGSISQQQPACLCELSLFSCQCDSLVFLRLKLTLQQQTVAPWQQQKQRRWRQQQRRQNKIKRASLLGAVLCHSALHFTTSTATSLCYFSTAAVQIDKHIQQISRQVCVVYFTEKSFLKPKNLI